MSKGDRCRIKEVSELQSTFMKLFRSVETFALFVPEGLVREIVSGDRRATRPRVENREVTIMFSDISDFTTICEVLSPTDQLAVLTRYLTAMAEIAEEYEGVLTEILGDGLLIFWNTPKDVEEHAAKACEAALAMQGAMKALNEELRDIVPCKLAIRIGLHTGNVLSGTIGCARKMKFGCLGDPVNLASRLEGLCKIYGVGVLCSGATFDALPSDSSLICRQLATVKVKGKTEPTCIYEVMGRGSSSGSQPVAQTQTSTLTVRATETYTVMHSDTCGASADLEAGGQAGAAKEEEPTTLMASMSGALVEDLLSHKQAYEHALTAFQDGRLQAASQLADHVLMTWPEDVAAERLKDEVQKALDEGVGMTAEDLAKWTGVTVFGEK